MAEDFSDQTILCELRKAMFQLASSGIASYTIAGRTFAKSDIAKIQDLIVQYEARVAAATSSSINGGGVLVRMNGGERESGYGFNP